MIGKVVGGVIGAFIFGPLWPLGLIIGIAAGHAFDRGRQSIRARLNPEERARVERIFLRALFPVLGHLAKADGHISDDEIKSTEELIRRMGLDTAARAEAITLFHKGKQSDFDLRLALNEFVLECDSYSDLKRIFMVYLVTLALADGVLAPGEETVLKVVAEKIGYSQFAFNQLIGMVKAQMAFRERQNSQSGYSYYQESHHGGRQSYSEPSHADKLALAYKALGVSGSDTDTVIKRAYRKLMSENHPDKLAGQGVPEDMIALATERSQEIQSAYELVKTSRKSK